MNYKELRVTLLRRFEMPKERSIRAIARSFTIAEKAVFYFFIVLFALSSFALIYRMSNAFMIEVPIKGGTLTEGVVGNPRFINPVLALSEADKNLTALVYSGLVLVTPDGAVQNDLAEELIISDDRKVYTARLRADARFHDGRAVTADDILFTVQKITNQNIKSPRRGNWDGVSVEKLDESTVTFTLRQAYTPFIYNLTLGILPKHIWNNVSDDEFAFSQFNTVPVGSGLYKIKKMEQNSGGIPNLYRLIPFEQSSGSPFINNVVFKFYPNEEELIEGLKGGSVESVAGISPDKAKELSDDGFKIITAPLPRVFAVFFNQHQAKVFLNKEVRRALDLASPKEKIVAEILGDYGTVIDGPLPAGIYSWAGPTQSNFENRLAEAKKILSEADWEPNGETGVLEKKSKSGKIALSFSISTGDAPELQAVAEELAASWRKLGAQVEVRVFEIGDLNQNVIRSRDFDTLLFGQAVSREADLYPFWHSSQKDDPGLNIALYTNGRADKLLEEARGSSGADKTEESYRAFAEEIKKDVPAIFLYTPSFLYVVPEKINAVSLGALRVSQDRFLGIRNWYIETDKVWKVFVD